MDKSTIFISYSHRDEVWKDRLKPHLKILEEDGRVSVWDDRKIDQGDKWYPEIKEAMEKAAVAVCLISADYLTSDFCKKEEIPFLLERCERDGMAILPILVRPCLWKRISWLKETQMLPRDGKTVAMDYKDSHDFIFTSVAETIFNIFEDPDYKPPQPPPPEWSPPDKVDTVRLPMTGAELFGRKKELELLDDAWESEETHVISLVAWGGVGKSTLVNKWMEKMGADNYRGAGKV
ncbi:MAG: toll/interleukin-1 receptor domain-containing protein, partial [Desulfobacterales bacterium]|nr:toll/interleukin-1 receptor domain-containing protein [Desulfobacterales bacterium]